LNRVSALGLLDRRPGLSFRIVMHVAAKTAIIQTRIPVASPITAALERPELGVAVGVAGGTLIIAVFVGTAAVALVMVGALVAPAVLGRRAVLTTIT
jgi:hypothetical protein